MVKENVLILGAAGRDFHNFNCYFRENERYNVVAFTATQIPKIDGRMYPPVLSGKLYPQGIKIFPEVEMERIIKEEKVSLVCLCYSDLPYEWVMNRAARASALGCNFMLFGHNDTAVKSKKPVIAICAVRTGCGKSQTTKYVCDVLKKNGKVPVVCRHPMPYGDLSKMVVQRFEKYEDCEKHNVTIEEREEYEQHIKKGFIVYAGVDYEKILRSAEAEADVVIWDGGNNDTPFFMPDLWMCVADPHRPGHEMKYFPGDVNFRAAHVIIINKVNTADPKNVELIKKHAKEVNPNAIVIETNSEITVDKPELVKGKKVVTVDDGPTLTHGEMGYGAGKYAAEKYEAKAVNPIPFAKGSIKELYTKFPTLGETIPAMGYFPEQIKDLVDTINAVECDAVLSATPFDLTSLIGKDIKKPIAVATYDSTDRSAPILRDTINEFVKKMK